MAAATLISPLAQELPYAAVVAIKRKKRKKKKKKKRREGVEEREKGPVISSMKAQCVGHL